MTAYLVARGVSAFTECLELYEQSKVSPALLSDAERWNAKVKALFVLFQGVSLGTEASSASSSAQENAKLAEWGASVAHLISDARAKWDGDGTPFSKFEAIFGNFAKSLRIASETSVLEEKRFIEMTPEERASATRSGYVETDGGLDWSDEKPVDLAECEERLKDAQSSASFFQVGEMLGKTHAISFAHEMARIFLEYIGVTRAVHRSRMHSDSSTFGPRRFIGRETIPEAFEDDPVLSQYICPITQCPIRYPLRDPVSKTLYEAHAILGWVINHHTSPMTRNRLETSDLEEVPEIQQNIDQRLRELESASADLHDS